MPKLHIGLLITSIWFFLCPNIAAQWSTIRGRVMEGKRPVSGAVVELQSGCQGTYSDSMGLFAFSNLPYGAYRIGVRSPERYVPDTLVELRDEDDPINVTIFLRREVCDSSAAQFDIDAGIPLFVIVQAFQGKPNTEADVAFEKRYGVRYDVQQNISLPDACVWRYNLAVIAHMDKKFGKQWREEVRHEIRDYFIGTVNEQK